MKQNLDKYLNRKIFLLIAIFFSFFKAYQLIPYGEIVTYIYITYGFLFFGYEFFKKPSRIFYHNCTFAYVYLITFIISLIYNSIIYNIKFSFPLITFISFTMSLVFLMSRDKDEDINELLKSFEYIMKITLFFSLTLGLFHMISLTFPLTTKAGIYFGFTGKRFASRFAGVCGNPNRLGQYSMSALLPSIYFIYLYYCNNIEKKYFVFSLINVFICLFCCILSGSRAVYLNLLINLILIIYILSKENRFNILKYKKYLPIIIFSFVLMLLIFIYIRGASFYVLDRLGLYYVPILVFLRNNLLIGPSYLRHGSEAAIVIEELISKYKSLEFLKLFGFHPHNSFLEALGTNGLLGFLSITLLFVRFFYMLFYIVKKYTTISSPKIKAMIICLVFSYVNTCFGMVSDGYVLSTIMFVLNNILGMICFGFIGQLYYLLYKDEKKIKYIW